MQGQAWQRFSSCTLEQNQLDMKMSALNKLRFVLTFPNHAIVYFWYTVWHFWHQHYSRSVRRYGVEVDPSYPLISPLLKQKILSGRYEFIEAAIAGRLVRPGDVVLEIGGGIGFLSAYLAVRVGKDGRIVTCEADPEVSHVARDTLHRNRVGNVQIVLSAVVAHVQGSYYLSQERDFWQRTLLTRLPLEERFRNSLLVSALDFKDLVSEQCPNVLVMDVEGLEYSLLTSCELPSSVRAVVLEIHSERLSHSQERDCIEILKKQGFKVKYNFGREFGFYRKTFASKAPSLSIL